MRWSLCKVPLRRVTPSSSTVCHVRMLRLKVYPDCKEHNNSQPLPFSTSQASHKRWTVAKSLGSEQQRPMWKVISISAFVAILLIWAVFRKETDIDETIYKPINQLLPDDETDDVKDK
ncbi:protein ccsmst1 [Spea bombifrons]|uniref:protein ccsmst1 n=1 Tax=Spea bombifrons TaxID=233779 RepID=UPI00234AB2E3|nr:protein ccsmst1 [Spea bombifrons]